MFFRSRVPHVGAFVSAVAMILSIGASAHAGTIKVSKSGPVTSIQAAIDLAGPGDSILVKGGRYAGALVIPAGKSNLKLRGVGKVIIDARAPGGAAMGPALTVLAENVSIRGFTLDHAQQIGDQHNGHGIEVHEPGLVVTRCTIRGSSDEAIRAFSANGLSISRCTLTSNGGGILAVGEQIVVRSTTVSRAATGGIVVFGQNATLSRCKVIGSTSDGIVAFGSGSRIERCVVRNVEADGIRCEGSGLAILRNAVTNAAGHGIRVEGADARIDANAVARCGGDGIHVFGPFERIARNRVDAALATVPDEGETPTLGDFDDALTSTGRGIFVAQAQAGGLVTRNRVRETTSAGIELHASCFGVVVTANRIGDVGPRAGAHGLVLRGSDHEASKNSIQRCMFDGIHVDGDAMRIHANVVKASGRDGIDVESGASSILTKNVVLGNAAEGIETNANGTEVLGNLAKGNRIDFAADGPLTVYDGNVTGDDTFANPRNPEID